jgi:enterochelin esterase-like enzyme
MSNRLLVTGLIVSGLLLSAGSDAASTTIHRTFASETLGREYAYNVYLPDGYDSANLNYAVLYLLHGSGGNENSWLGNAALPQTADHLIEIGAIPPAIIVMPGSRSWWVDGYNEMAETAFFNDLIPHIEANWRVVPEREGRVVAGISAGGYGTVNFVLEHPDVFAAGAAISPAAYVPVPPLHSAAQKHATYLKADGTFDRKMWEKLNYTQYIDDYKMQDIVVPLYISSGDHDTFDIAFHGAALYQALREHQAEFVEFRVVDGGHDWGVWAKALPEAMEYVLKYASRPIEDVR